MRSTQQSAPILKIYGERNTGTNYLSQLISINLRAHLLPGVVPWWVARIADPMRAEFLKDAYFRRTFPRNLGWKHSKVLPSLELRNQPLAESTKFITLTKNPYSWLLSLHKRPYHSLQARSPDFESFATSPWRTVGRDNTAVVLPSPVHLWNEKNASYLQLSDHFTAIHIKYEDLLVNPGETIAQIAETLNIDRKRDQFANLDQSAKGDTSTFTDYQRYYLQEEWRKHFTSSLIWKINATLNDTVVRQFGYSQLTPDETKQGDVL